MRVQELRRNKGWSQEQLAQISGLSTRTIQRVERGQKAGYESLKCLAAVLETDVADLTQENTMAIAENTITPAPALTDAQKSRIRAEEEAVDYVENLTAFHINWICCVFASVGLYGLNMFISPDTLWVIYPMMVWGFGIFLHALILFGLFGVFGNRWTEREIEKRLNQRDR